jgi:hypothetical protein
MGGLLDNLGSPQIRNRLGDTLTQVEKTLKDQAKRSIAKLPSQKVLSDTLNKARNTIRQDVTQSSASGMGEGTKQAKTELRPYLIGGGLLLGGLLLVMWMRKKK